MSKSAKIAIPVVVVVLLGALGVWWFVLRDDAPPPASLSALDSPAGSSGSAPAKGTIDGTWKVAKGDQVFVGYRIQELFGGETVKKTAVGRTPDVEGTLKINGTTVESVDVKADVTKLKSDQSRRDSVVKNRGLQTELFPDATFKLTEPITLPSAPKQGEEVTVQAKGDLTLHGQTRPVTVDLKAKWTGDAITVTGSTPIKLADYGMEVISMPVVTIDDNGSMELQLRFVPAA